VAGGLTAIKATSSFVISPSPYSQEFPTFGSQQLHGSGSKYNMQTAMIVYRKVHWLITIGGFNPSQILVTVFYAA